MTAPPLSVPGQAELDAARLLLARMGISPVDLLQTASSRPPVPTFAEYIPVVSAAVSAGTRRVYGTYWNRILDQRGKRQLDEPTPSDVRQLAEHVRTHGGQDERGGGVAGRRAGGGYRLDGRQGER